MAALATVETQTERFQLDEVGECYFAALVDGLRIINEKELERGIEFGSTAVDADALVDYVRDKGDVLVHHMNAEHATNGKRLIRWSDAELKSVAFEARRRNPGTLAMRDFFAAQSVLPSDRRKTLCTLYTMGKQLRSVIDAPAPSLQRKAVLAATKKMPADPAERPPYREMIRAVVNGIGSPLAIAATPSVDVSDSLAAALSQQLVSGLLALNVKVLEMAAERLRVECQKATDPSLHAN